MQSLFSVLAFMNVGTGSAQVFNWLVNLTTVGGFFTWMAISTSLPKLIHPITVLIHLSPPSDLTYLRFYAGLKRQGIDRTKFIYYSSLQPYLSMWGVFWTSFCILINGFAVFAPGEWSTSDFLTAYINIPIFFALWIGYRIWKRTSFWKVDEMDFVRGIPTIEETEAPYVPPATLKEKIWEKLF